MKTCRKGLHQYEEGPIRCPQCDQDRKNKWSKANSAKIKIRQHAYKLANPDRVKASKNKWIQNNPDYIASYYKNNTSKIKARTKIWKNANPERVKASNAASVKANPTAMNAATAKRRSAKLQRTPKWLTYLQFEHVKMLYEAASAMTKETGVEFNVDHIVPLQGKNVSGLHVPWNLQVLPKKENCNKGNKHVSI